ncbi:hypothetical protein [Desulfoluna sp.]|uniref:hypothetical protein n=1 Tax=Desulfoluna sp. TaxID=2045199 RepID=UPI0026294EE6|nr:hypothetical protein [Desulfoluna sp.]
MGNKRKRTPAEKEAKKARQKKYMYVFMNGKQKRIKRPPTVDGIPLDEFIQRNADPIWLHQNEMWEYMPVEEPFFSEVDDRPRDPKQPVVLNDFETWGDPDKTWGDPDDSEDIPF